MTFKKLFKTMFLAGFLKSCKMSILIFEKYGKEYFTY